MSCRIDGSTGRINGCRYETVYADLHVLVLFKLQRALGRDRRRRIGRSETRRSTAPSRREPEADRSEASMCVKIKLNEAKKNNKARLHRRACLARFHESLSSAAPPRSAEHRADRTGRL